MPAADEPQDSELRFRADLVQVHRLAGSPNAFEMAARSHCAPGLFAFLAGSGLPGWDEVAALLTGTGQVAKIQRWRDRWERLSEQRKQRRQLAFSVPDDVLNGQFRELAMWATEVPRNPVYLARVEAGAAAVANPDRHRAGPLNQALAAATEEEFGLALQQLRLDASLSVRDIERETDNRLSKSVVQRLTSGKLPRTRGRVQDFVRACGRSSEEAAEWENIAGRIRRGEPPAWQGSAIPAAELLASEAPQQPPAAEQDGRIALLEEENATLRSENEKLDRTVDFLTRAFRTVDHELEVARAQLAVAGAVEADAVRYDFGTRRSRSLRWGSEAAG